MKSETLNLPPTPAERLIYPMQEFLHKESSGGILLLLCALAALLWANSPLAEVYHALWQVPCSIGIGRLALTKPLLLWINDGLMALFFFVVGLEVKRELLVGELASSRKAVLPLVAAVGGMAFPAIFYMVFNFGGPGARGWGIPVATDIAFALGILSLLGKRVPWGLKVFLTALAIVDDIGAVLIIALFYTAEISWSGLAAATGFFLLLVLANRLEVRHPLVYAVLGAGLWAAFLQSGVHATVAGVLAAMAIPAKVRLDCREFAARSRAILREFECADAGQRQVLEPQQAVLQTLESLVRHVESPLQRMERALHPWVAFLIMPLFAFANAGVSFGGGVSSLAHPTALGIVAGLVLGNQVGINALTRLAVRAGLADLPNGVTWRHVYGLSCLAGMGFTMSLFIANLAFGGTPLLDTAKVGILTASAVAGTLGLVVLGTIRPAAEQTGERAGGEG